MLGEIEIVSEDTCDIILTDFGYTFWKHQTICGFLIFPGGVKNGALARKGLSLYLYQAVFVLVIEIVMWFFIQNIFCK